MRRAPAAGPPPGTAVIPGRSSGDQVLAEAVLIVGEVADANEVPVLVVSDLVETAADASPCGVAERPGEEDVPLRLDGPVLADAGVGARQAGDERVQVAGRLREPLLRALLPAGAAPMTQLRGEATQAMLEVAIQEGYDPAVVNSPGFLEESICWVANEVAAYDSRQFALSFLGPKR